MEIICMHCKKVLVAEDGKGGGISHGDCMGYGAPCKESIAYYKEIKMIDFVIAKRTEDGLPAFQY